MKKNSFKHTSFLQKAWLIAVLTVGFLITPALTIAQNKKASQIDIAAFQSGKYHNTLMEAGYSKSDIDQKVDKAYHDIFEGPKRVYFEVGDSMAYVSDLKNHDARTEGLSYGMMIAVQLNKKPVFDKIWRWSKKYLQHQEDGEDWLFLLPDRLSVHRTGHRIPFEKRL